jgi:hypothetical protein
VQIGIAGSACAAMLFAADFWKTKDSSQWTDEEISKVLSDSPWAKAKTVQPQQPQTQRVAWAAGAAVLDFPAAGTGRWISGRRRRLSGRWRRIQVAIRKEAAAIRKGGGSNGDPSQNEPMNLTIRWASAAPIQQAA